MFLFLVSPSPGGASQVCSVVRLDMGREFAYQILLVHWRVQITLVRGLIANLGRIWEADRRYNGFNSLHYCIKA